MDLFRLNINSAKITNIFSNTYGFSSIETNQRGVPVLGTSSNPDNTSDLYAKIDGKWTSLIKTKFGEDIDILSFDEDNNLAYLRANIQGRDKLQLLRLNMTTGKIVTLHQDPQDESDVYDVLFNDEGAPLAVSYYGGRLRTYPLDDTFAGNWQKINDHFTQDIEITITDRNEKTGLWQIHVASDVDMGSDYRFNAKTGLVSQDADEKIKGLTLLHDLRPRAFESEVSFANLAHEYDDLNIYFVSQSETIESAEYYIEGIDFTEIKSLDLATGDYEVSVVYEDDNGDLTLLYQSENFGFEASQYTLVLYADDTQPLGFKLAIH